MDADDDIYRKDNESVQTEESLVSNWTTQNVYSPGEVVLRYRAPLPQDATLLSAWLSSQNKWWLFAMGGAWLVPGFSTYTIMALFWCTIHSATSVILPYAIFRHREDLHFGIFWQALIALISTVYAAALLVSIFALSTFLMYCLIVFLNLRLFYGKQWLETIMGPTHIGLSSAGIKLSWQAHWLAFYGPMVAWRDIGRIEYTPSKIDQSNYELVFKFNRNGANAGFVIDPNGFSNDAERKILFEFIEQCAPTSAIDPKVLAYIAARSVNKIGLTNSESSDYCQDESSVFNHPEFELESGQSILNAPILRIEAKADAESEPIENSVKLKSPSKQTLVD
jgi:hypothetical protein